MADYQGISGSGPGPSNVIFVPENIPHFYDENGVLKVVAVGYDSNGNTPDEDPAPENRADTYHRAPKFVAPTAEFDSSGKCTKAGVAGASNYNLGDQSGSPTGGPADGTGVAKSAALAQLGIAAKAYAKA